MKTINICTYLFCLVLFTINTYASDPVNATLRWSAPVENIDDTPIEDLGGFNLYQRPDTNFVTSEDIVTSLTENIIAAPQIQGTNALGQAYGEEYHVAYTISNSSWFTVTAFDLHGHESDFAPPLWTDIETPHPPTNLFLSMGADPSNTIAILAGPIITDFNDNSYFMLDQSNWIQAESTAQTIGGHLVTVNTPQEQIFIMNTFGTFDNIARNIWIGLYDSNPIINSTNNLTRRAEFVWSSGELTSYANWIDGEPNNYRDYGEFYVHMMSPNHANAGQWNDTWHTNYNQGPIHGVVEVVPQ